LAVTDLGPFMVSAKAGLVPEAAPLQLLKRQFSSAWACRLTVWPAGIQPGPGVTDP
jgi:hypothetical protein